MSQAHLTVGSTKPPCVEGLARLYSMEYCPYAHRARLILLAKQVPHDIVNINLMAKPDWYLKIHPEGKVPALDTGSQIIVESLDICDYLNDKYPEPALYAAEPAEKQAQQELIKKINGVTNVFYKCVLEMETKSKEEWLAELKPHLDVFEAALEKAGPFFGGSAPSMVDYMLWPWAERAGAIPLTLGAKLPLAEGEYKALKAWRKVMRTLPAVEKTYHGPEKFQKIIWFKTKKMEADYDSV